MRSTKRPHALWGAILFLCVLFSWALAGQQAIIRLSEQALEASRAEAEAKQAELERLQSTLRSTEKRLREYEAYFERIRPIAARLGSQSRVDPWALAAQVDRSSRRYGVDPMLVVAVGQTESDWNVRALGRRGEVGPMQVMPSTFRALGGRDPWDWRENVDLGTRYLAMMLQLAGGDVRLAVAYYNAGPSRPASTVQRISARHVEKVMQARARL
ncbi:lytic transglycosylase domain-containing protein [Limnochorda pilosa]|uniref:Transglycosylase SLT domain-containing protein n=1 Tax=Limnochorda pilosa TaxID=1555112 RepID=A0A0K2SJP2_LIMPI|nr:transglycosylase SLT domain-containing protein [Limnochorda pilosa]BAS27331.1 hypothetical protein LIP_1482 [Limnochorda pilosa]